MLNPKLRKTLKLLFLLSGLDLMFEHFEQENGLKSAKTAHEMRKSLHQLVKHMNFQFVRTTLKILANSKILRRLKSPTFRNSEMRLNRSLYWHDVCLPVDPYVRFFFFSAT